MLLNLGVGGEIFKGQDIVRGQAQDGVRAERSGKLAGAEHGGVEGFGGLVVGDDDDAGGVGGVDERRQIEGAGGGGEARDATTPGAGAEMAADTLEGLRVLEVREEFANKREDHASLILPLAVNRRIQPIESSGAAYWEGKERAGTGSEADEAVVDGWAVGDCALSRIFWAEEV
jgi:hypothetical protein